MNDLGVKNGRMLIKFADGIKLGGIINIKEYQVIFGKS